MTIGKVLLIITIYDFYVGFFNVIVGWMTTQEMFIAALGNIPLLLAAYLLRNRA